MRVHFLTQGCKANQYDTEKFRQELASRGARVVETLAEADTLVLNTCTVTNQADSEARKLIRRAQREHPGMRIVVAGCSAALHFSDYQAMPEVFGVLRGHDPQALGAMLVEHIAPMAPMLEVDEEPIGASLLVRNERGTRGWMKIQDGCDRRCSFCATRLARGQSRSRPVTELVQEARQLAAHHREIVLTGIHIGHYGLDLEPRTSLSGLVAALLQAVPGVRFRLGSVEATEIDDLLVELLESSAGALVPHLHVPMQAGSNAVLRAMRRWHTREQYRDRLLDIAARMSYLGLGADIITGFPGESEEDFRQTRALVEELPYTYLHVFPYSPRDNTAALDLPNPVPRHVAAQRSQELRELAMDKGVAYRHQRAGQAAHIVVEADHTGLTEDYLRVRLQGTGPEDPGRLVYTVLALDADGELVGTALGRL